MVCCTIVLKEGINSRIKDQWLEPSQGRQKGKVKERPKDNQPAGTEEKGESYSCSHGRKLFHS